MSTEEQRKRQHLTEVRLSGLVTEAEWQCGWLSVPHAKKGEAVYLVWETPGGDLQVCVTLRAGLVRVAKV